MTDPATIRTLAQEAIEGDHDSFLVLRDALESDSDPRLEALEDVGPYGDRIAVFALLELAN